MCKAGLCVLLPLQSCAENLPLENQEGGDFSALLQAQNVIPAPQLQPQQLGFNQCCGTSNPCEHWGLYQHWELLGLLFQY